MPSRASQSLSFPRRTFFLKNVLSGCFVTQLDRSEGPNVLAQQLQLSAWYFIYRGDHGLGQHLFAVVSASHRTTLDHYGGQHINSSKYAPWDDYHLWQPIPRDGFFILKNLKTGRLLCHDMSSGTGAVGTVDSTNFLDPACHWKVVDASGASSSHCTVIYDSMLSFLPPDALGAPTDSISSVSGLARSSAATPDQPRLRVESAAGPLQASFLESLEREQRLLQELLRSGYVTFVVVPQMISAYGDGRWRQVIAADDARLFNGPIYRNSGRVRVCR